MTVAEIVRVYQQAEAQVREGFRLVREAEKSLDSSLKLANLYGFHISSPGGWRMNFEDVETPLKELRKQVWQNIVERLQLRSMMSNRDWEALSKKIEAGDMPEITEGSVNEALQQYLEDLPRMLERAVDEVFEWLRPRRSHYKTNSELEIGPKVILSMMVDSTWSDRWDVNHYFKQRLTSLDRVFAALDGKGAIAKTHYGPLHDAITALDKNETSGSTEYFEFKCFKNGNLHLKFRRLDLLKKFNEMAGGRRLRPAGV